MLRNQQDHRSLALALSCAIASSAALSACASEEAGDGDGATNAPHSERAGIGLAEVQQALGPGAVVDQRRSLAVTDTALLTPFTLTAVLNQLIAQTGAPLTAAQLFRQLWDTQNPSPGQVDLPGNAHCSDNGGVLNGFGYPCRLVDGQQALPAGSITINSYAAIGLYNRFDLAPLDGSNCGEYRAVFGKLPGQGPGRSFIIFEAVLPNPRPDLGLEGCRPVANFWRDLTSSASSTATRTSQLQSFYFTGLPGFRPVFHVDNYGGSSTGLGQVRTNQFVQFPWLLREFKLTHLCGGGGTSNCPPRFAPSTVKTNPFGDLFDPASAHALAPAFQSAFLNQVPLLAVNNLNTFTMVTDDQFNPGQSDSQTSGSVDNYVAQFGSGANPFRAAIQTRLTNIGSPLTPDQIVARALTQSCGGCHQRSNGANLGGGLIWPASDSSGFVHSSEFTEAAPEGPRFRISPALITTFLPRRKVVLEAFLNKLRTLASARLGPLRIAAFGDNVYFVEAGAAGPTVNQITRVAAGGSATVLLANRANINGLAADSTRIYWTEATGTIFRAAIGASALPLASGRTGLGAIAVDNLQLFWVETSGGTSSVFQMPITGSPINVVASGRPAITAIAADASNIYWVESGALIAFDRALGVPMIMTTGLPPISSLSVNNGKLYWAEPSSGLIRTMATTSRAITTLHAGLTGLVAAAVDGFSFYWLEAAGNVKAGPK